MFIFLMLLLFDVSDFSSLKICSFDTKLNNTHLMEIPELKNLQMLPKFFCHPQELMLYCNDTHNIFQLFQF